MKAKEIRDKTMDAIEKQERDLYDQLFKLRFQMATNQNENPGRIRTVRKDLARVKTVLRERRGPAVPQVAKVAAPARPVKKKAATKAAKKAKE